MHLLILSIERMLMGLFGVILGLTWLAGFVIAKGVWSTIFCIIPFYAWYLVVENIMKTLGWVV